MSKRQKHQKRSKPLKKFQGVPLRRTSIGDIINFGARNPSEQDKLDRYRRDIKRLAEELAPTATPAAAKRYLSEASRIASLDPGQIWFFLHNRDQQEAVEAFAKLRRLVIDFVSGRRLLPRQETVKPAPPPPPPPPVPIAAKNSKSPEVLRQDPRGTKPSGPKKAAVRRRKKKRKGKETVKTPRVWSGNSRKPGSHRGPY